MSKFYTTHYIEDVNCIFIICVFVRDTKYNVNEKKNLTIALTMVEKIVTHSNATSRRNYTTSSRKVDCEQRIQKRTLKKPLKSTIFL